MATITLAQDDGPMRLPLIVSDDGRSILVQTAYDYPGTASMFGWSVRSVIVPGYALSASCDHDGTDGTIDCTQCGTLAGSFIADARDYLDDHIGDTIEDPGYFGPTHAEHLAHWPDSADATCDQCINDPRPAGFDWQAPE